MGKPLSQKLEEIPFVKWLVRLLKRVRLRAFEGMSLFDLLILYIRGIIRGALSTRASAISFSLFMASFPLLIFLITLIPKLIPYIQIGDGDFEMQFLHFLETLLPDASREYVLDTYEELRNQRRGGWLSSSFLISIVLLANGVNAIFEGFETSYHIELTRNFFRQYAYALMVGLILCVLLILGAIVYIYFEFYVLAYLQGITIGDSSPDLGEGGLTWLRAGQVLVFVLLTYLTTSVLYYFGTREGKRSKFFSYGALMTTLLILLTSYLFGIYIDSIARYNELYGALAGLLILMVYIWLNSNLLLLGFELNATLSYLHRNLEKGESDS